MHNQKLKIKTKRSKVDNEKLIFGKKKPIVGVMIRRNLIYRLLRQEKVWKHSELKEANKKAGITLYFFSIEGVDFKRKRIKGIYFNENKGLWERKEFPYPNIIYKSSYSSRYRKEIYEFQRQLENQNVKALNYLRGFNKWEVHSLLSKDETFKQYLPFTVIYNKADDLKKMFAISDKLYLKAFRGGRGKQVIRISKLSEQLYELSYFNHRLHQYRINNFNTLIEIIGKFFGKRRFIIQQAIDLINIGPRIVDLRAEVQRDGNGKITIAAIPVRVSQENSPITTHAASYKFDYFFKNILKYSEEKFEELKNKINNFLNAAYQSIEKFYGPSGEIGIDVGLDKMGRLWFIECNARSLKVSLYKAYDKQTINQSFLNLLEYAKFRYNFGV